MSNPQAPGEIPKSYMPPEHQVEKFEVKTFQVQCKCPEIGCEGHLTFTNQKMAGLTLTPYLHACDKCRTPRMMAEQYPGIVTERAPSGE